MSDQTGRPVAQPSNVLGIVGFVASIVGLLTCGTLSVIGLVISLIALFKPPRGFALAGAIISLLGTVFFALWGMVIVMGFAGLTAAGGAFATVAVLAEARQAVEGERRAAGTGDVLDDAQGNAIAGRFTDGWGQALRYERQGDTFRILSAGPDKQFGTADDLDLDDPNLEIREQKGAPK
jgi:hypothetical protein